MEDNIEGTEKQGKLYSVHHIPDHIYLCSLHKTTIIGRLYELIHPPCHQVPFHLPCRSASARKVKLTGRKQKHVDSFVSWIQTYAYVALLTRGDGEISAPPPKKNCRPAQLLKLPFVPCDSWVRLGVQKNHLSRKVIHVSCGDLLLQLLHWLIARDALTTRMI